MKKMGGGLQRNYRGFEMEMEIDGKTVYLLQEKLGTGGRNVYVRRDYATDAYIGRIQRTSGEAFRAFPPATYGALDGESSNATSVAMRQGQLVRSMRAASAYLLRLYNRAEGRFLEGEGVDSLGLGMVEFN